MKKNTTALFAGLSTVLYFLAFLLPYFFDAGVLFYLADYFNRFVILFVPVGIAALLLPSALEEKPKQLFLRAFLFSLTHVAYTLLSYYLDLFDYGFSTGFTLFFGFLLSLLFSLLMGTVLYLSLLLLRRILARTPKEKKCDNAFDFTQKIPFCVGLVNGVYLLGTLLYEIVNAILFLCRYWTSYSPSEIVYIGVTFLILFAFFFPIQKICVSLARSAEKAE